MTNRPEVENFTSRRDSICVLGLGYVGLPLAVMFARKFNVIGFDLNTKRVDALVHGHDETRELTEEQLAAVYLTPSNEATRAGLRFSSDPKVISEARLIIVAVPTPIDVYKNPDLELLLNASRTIGKYIEQGTTVVYESTVYPGCTEEQCIPEIENASKFKWKKDFFVGYSPERINPGDKEHTVDKIMKVVSGDTCATVELLRHIYGSVITAGIFAARSIATAEAAKVIENTQRDLNIALMNELALIFDRMGISSRDVLEAAGTKWNFMPFRPGLVGGHCIGVDPYYLTFKAESLGYHPQVILAGRRINDNMGKVIAERTIKKLIFNGSAVKGAKVLILGWTFKENVPDIRNTRVIDIYQELKAFGALPMPYDPQANNVEVLQEYGLELIEDVAASAPYDAVILAVKHQELIEKYTLEALKNLGGGRLPVLIDVKHFFSRNDMEAAGFIYWQL